MRRGQCVFSGDYGENRGDAGMDEAEADRARLYVPGFEGELYFCSAQNRPGTGVDIYYEGGQSFVTVKDKADKFKTLEDANNADYSIGAQTGSIQLTLANENAPDADIVSLPKVTDLITELLTGKMDGAFIETAVAESYKENYPDLEIVCDVPYEATGSSIGVSKGNEALLKAVNEAIKSAKEDGSLDKFVADATELAAGQTYEGTLDDNGAVPETDAE